MRCAYTHRFFLISYTVNERVTVMKKEIIYDEDERKDSRNAVLSNAMEATQSVMIK